MALLFPVLGISQNYKLVNDDYPEIVMKKIANDTVSARLITSNKIMEGFVVYRQIKRLDTDKIYRFPESFLDNDFKELKSVLYYESDKITNDVIYWNGINVLTDNDDIITTPTISDNIHNSYLGKVTIEN